MLSPLHPREPRRHASHKARHQGGPGAKEDIDTKAKKGIRVYLERRGFEILEEDWARGGDVADFIARDEDDLLFVHCQITQNGGEGFPEEDADRAALERLAAAYLAEHLDSEDIRIRFDVCVLSSSRRQNRRYDFDTFGVSRADLFFYSRDLPSISAFSILLLAPPNSTSLPWCMMRSMMAEASLSSPNTTPHLLNSIFAVITRLRFS